MNTPSRPRFQPRLESLEERCTPSASPTVPFKETLTVDSVAGTGEIHFHGQATHFGAVTSVVYLDNTFVKTAKTISW